MDTLSAVLRYELLFLLTALVLLIGYQLITNKINTEGLLLDKTGGRSFSPGRLQMLIVTLVIAVYYVFLVMETKNAERLPDMPNELLMALGGSHVFYLGGKLYGLIATKLGFASPRLKERAAPKQ